jgi:hypothetical protein
MKEMDWGRFQAADVRKISLIDISTIVTAIGTVVLVFEAVDLWTVLIWILIAIAAPVGDRLVRRSGSIATA